MFPLHGVKCTSSCSARSHFDEDGGKSAFQYFQSRIISLFFLELLGLKKKKISSVQTKRTIFSQRGTGGVTLYVTSAKLK